MTIQVLYSLPVPSTSLTREPYFSTEDGRYSIRFGYIRDGKDIEECVAFNNVAAVRTRAERCCSVEQIETSYDCLVEFESSQWVMEVLADMQDHMRDQWRTRHFMICLDSVGCYEVIADDWEITSRILSSR
jgi:hypothetical protein